MDPCATGVLLSADQFVSVTLGLLTRVNPAACVGHESTTAPGMARIDNAGAKSSSVTVSVAARGVPSVVPVGLPSVSSTDSLDSGDASLSSGTVKVRLVTPLLNVRTPLVATKSVPAVAVPACTLNGTLTFPSDPPVRVTVMTAPVALSSAE